ncbi:tetraspanin-15-like isoform X2 [Xenia sp. Carnegie-2017]|uniref:tetraspanin-15-like isoform X2 n=1 Tax=Xenia sp. Carnegie-2017 TaxID=2897299 RepID=UPI001F03A332|nr:tetraspanin-15-like isoform X2 [Xenia sp. Carnegie-2017]
MGKAKYKKFFLFGFNVTFMVIGGFLIATGVYANVEKSEYYRNYKDFYDFISDPSIAVIICGSIILFVSMFGMIGALRDNIKFLHVIKDSVNTAFLLAIIKYRRDPDLKNAVDGFQLNFECCGSTTINDWDQNPYFRCGAKTPEACGVPVSCCKIKEKISKVKTQQVSSNVTGPNFENFKWTDINLQCGYKTRQHHRLTYRNEIHTRGCLDALVLWLYDNMLVIFGVVVASVLPEIFGACLTFFYIAHIKRARQEWVDGNRRSHLFEKEAMTNF